MRRMITCVLVLCVLSAAQACSWLFVESPPPDHLERTYFTCTSSRLAPTADVVLGLGYGVSALAQYLVLSQTDGAEGLAPLALLPAGASVAFVASAVSGFSDISECRQALEAFHARLAWSPQSHSTPTPQPATPTVTPTVPPNTTPATPATPPDARVAPVRLFVEPPTTSQPPNVSADPRTQPQDAAPGQ